MCGVMIAFSHFQSGCPFGSGNLNPISHDRRTKSIRLCTPKPRKDAPHDRPLERAAKRRNGQRCRVARQVGRRALQFGLRRLQLADVLRGKIPSSIELVEATIVRAHRLFDCLARLECRRTRGIGFQAPLLEIGVRRLLLSNRLAMRVEPHAIKTCDSGDTARHAPEGAQIVSAEQESQIAGAATLVDFDEPLAHTRCLGETLRFQRQHTCR